MIDSCASSSAPWAPASAAPSSPVATGATMSQTQSAIDDSSDEGIVLSLGGGSNLGATYSPQGLLDSFLQAGTPTEPDPNLQSLWVTTLQANPDMAGTVATDSLDQGLVGTLSGIA